MRTIVHVIDSLHRGGAESLLVDLLPELKKHYNIVLVTLSPINEFGEDVFDHCHRFYCLHHQSRFTFKSVFKLKQIIKKHQPVLVRSQLVWSSIIARLACPGNLPLVFSVHTTIDVFRLNIKTRLLGMLDKLTLRKYHTMIGVTQTVVDDYSSTFNFRGAKYVLYNYVRNEFFNSRKRNQKSDSVLRLITVGNLKPEKNHQYLIDAFKKLKDVNVSLDVYGDGLLQEQLAKQIQQAKVAIQLKGKVKDISKVIFDYDGFVMVSSFEGFGISVAEAMAAELPLILSDLPVFHEITHNNACFVDLSSPDSFVIAVKSLFNNENLSKYQEENRKIAEENYSQRGYLSRLLSIYEEVIASHANSGNSIKQLN